MGGKHSTSTSKVSVPPEVLARYNAINTRAEGVAATPFERYGNQASDFVAQMNAQQNAGISDINATAGSYRPYMSAATDATNAGMGPAYQGINNYMSPYIKNVADTTGAMMRQQFEQAQSGNLGNAISSGAFGGDRAGIAAANLQQQNQMGYGKTMADIYNQGYTQALGASQADLARQMQGGSQLAALGAQEQQLGLQGAQAKIAAGTMQQQTEQAGKDAMIKQFMQEKGYPFQVAQFLANIAMGTGAASGSTTTTETPRNWMGFKSGGGVGGYADGGGVAGPKGYSQSPLWGEGYVPSADLPVGRLMVADPPDQQQGSGMDTMMKLAQLAMTAGAKRGGAIDGRHGYATDGSVEGGVFLPNIVGENETRGEQLARILRPSYSFATNSIPKATEALGARITSFVPEVLSYGLAGAQFPNASDLMHSTAVGMRNWANDRRDESMQYRGSNQPEPLQGQAAIDATRTTPEQSAALEDWKRQNMDMEPSRTDAGGVLPSGYGTALASGPAAAGWIPSDGPQTSIMTPHGVAGRPDVPVGSLPAARMTMFNTPVGSMPAQEDYAFVTGRPDVPVGNMPASQQGLNLGASITGTTDVPGATGVVPISAQQDLSARAGLAPPIRPVPHAGGVGTAVVDENTNAPTGVVGVDSHTLYTQGIIPIESNGQQFKDGRPLTSPKGAVGISQMLPSTGPEAAKLAGLEWDEQRFYNDEKYNAALGEAYFSDLNRRYGNPVMAAAAYNGGQGNLASAIDRAAALGGSYLDYMPAETQAYAKKFAARTGNLAPELQGKTGGVSGANTNGMPSEAQQPSGLGGADLLHVNKPYEDRNLIGKFFHDKDTGKLNQNAILSLLSGLGHAAEAPTISPLGAIISGIGSGADTYKQLQKQAADIAQTQAQTSQTNVQTDVNRFFSAIPGSDGFPLVIVGPGKAITLTEYLKNPVAFSTGDVDRDAAIQREAQRISSTSTTGGQAGGETGATAPTGVRWTPASDAAIDAAKAKLSSRPGDFSTNDKNSREVMDAAAGDRSTALASKPNTNELAYTVGSAIADGNMGTAEGYMSDKVIPMVNAALRSIDPALEISSADSQSMVLQKLATLSGAAMTPEQERAASVYRDFVSIAPDLKMTPEAGATITSGMMLQNQDAIDRANYYSAFMSRAGSGVSMQDVDAAYAAEYSQMHQMEKDSLQRLFTMAEDPEKGKTVKEFLRQMNSGAASQEDAQAVLRYLLGDQTPPLLARYFIKGM